MAERKYVFGPLYEDEEGNTRIDLRSMGEKYVRAYRAAHFERQRKSDRRDSEPGDSDG